MRRREAPPVTVGALVRRMGVQPEHEIAWSVGRTAAQFWRDQHGGQAPPVALVPKTSGGGTHHMAVYPPSWRPMLQRLIRLAAASLAAPDRAARRRRPGSRAGRGRQRDLFEGAR